MVDHGLSPLVLEKLLDVLSPFADHIERVALFGSRAAGSQRANSDIDLVLYGSLDEACVDRIATLFEESTLLYEVDVVGAAFIDYPPLQEHIRSTARDLFTADGLRQHQAARVIQAPRSF
jgi:uncharacterized protein